MNLDSFGISNFKAFGSSLQSFPLKPLTLVFGPNSAGKSSLVQSLRWALESAKAGDFERRSAEGSSGGIGLGSFRSLIHRQDTARRIEIKFSFSNQDSSVPVEIILQLGFTTLEDLIRYKKELNSKWDVADDHAKTLELVYRPQQLIDELFNYNPPDNDEIERIILNCELCQTQIDRSIERNAELELEYGKVGSHEHFDGRRPDTDDFVKAYRVAQGLRIRLLEIEDKHGDQLEIHWEKVERSVEQERHLCSVQSIGIRQNDCLIMRAVRIPGESDLQIQMLEETQAESLASPPDSWITSFMHAASSSPATANVMFAESLFTSDKVRFPVRDNLPAISKLAIDNSAAWLNYARKHVIDLEKKLIYLGPLRHLPERRSLVGVPGEPPADEKMESWVYLRDQPILQKQVNRLLERLNCRRYRFQTKLFSTRRGFFEAARKAMPSGFEMNSWNEDETAWGKFDEKLKESPSSELWADLVLFDIENQVAVSMRDVGVGISQMTPILIQLCMGKGRFITIEQPEIHLHPALQAELGDVFIESALGENKNTFLLETHSEHLILRILRRIRETTRGKLPDGHFPVTPDDIAVLYVEPGDEGSVVRELRVNDQGRFIDNWPNGFFEERFSEEF